jgi:hypothetical protein
VHVSKYLPGDAAFSIAIEDSEKFSPLASFRRESRLWRPKLFFIGNVDLDLVQRENLQLERNNPPGFKGPIQALTKPLAGDATRSEVCGLCGDDTRFHPDHALDHDPTMYPRNFPCLDLSISGSNRVSTPRHQP